MDSLASYLAGHGYEGITFDFVGHKLGGSGGEMRRMMQAPENLRDVLSWARLHTTAERFVLVGHSLGGASALQVAAWEQLYPVAEEVPPIASVISICIGAEPAKGFESPLGKAMLEQRKDYVIGAPVNWLLDELSKIVLSAKDVAPLPALFIAGRQDILVSIARVEELANMAGKSASVSILDTSHLEAPDKSRSLIFQWLEHLGV